MMLRKGRCKLQIASSRFMNQKLATPRKRGRGRIAPSRSTPPRQHRGEHTVEGAVARLHRQHLRAEHNARQDVLLKEEYKRKKELKEAEDTISDLKQDVEDATPL